MAVGQENFFLVDENKKLWSANLKIHDGDRYPGEFTLVPGLENVDCRAVEATTHYLVLTEEGEVYSFGQNSGGQCGVGSTVNLITPQKMILASRIIDIAAGTYFSVMVDEDGCVWVCGSNSSGKLGGAMQERKLQIPVKLENLPSINSVSAGYDHSLLLDVEGNVWAFGANGYGQLGLGLSASSTVKVPTKVALPPIAEIAAGNQFSLFLDKEGFVWGCGSNANAGCLESDTVRVNPHKILFLPKIVSISAEANGSFITDAGDLYSTHYGQMMFSPTHKPLKQAVVICNDVVAVASGMGSQLILDYTFDVYLRNTKVIKPIKIPTPRMGILRCGEIKSANKILG